MSIESAREFFGWCAVVNIGLLALTSTMVIALRGFITGIHAKMFGLSEPELHRAYFRYLASFKIAVIVFSIVPYIALRMMS